MLRSVKAIDAYGVYAAQGNTRRWKGLVSRLHPKECWVSVSPRRYALLRRLMRTERMRRKETRAVRRHGFSLAPKGMGERLTPAGGRLYPAPWLSGHVGGVPRAFSVARSVAT